MLNTKCRLHGSDHPDALCPSRGDIGLEYEAALDRLQQRFNEVWKQHQQMLLALENARDVIHRANCPAPASLPQKCWKECEEAEDAMLEAGWLGHEEDRR